MMDYALAECDRENVIATTVATERMTNVSMPASIKPVTDMQIP